MTAPGAAGSSLPTWLPLRRRGFAAFVALVAVMAAIAIVCLVIAITAIDQPFAGFLYYPFRNVGSVGDLEWAGLKAGARYQDIVEEVNGQRVSTTAALHRIVTATPVGTPVTYLLNRGGTRFEIRVPVSVFTLANFVKLFSPLFLAGILFFLVGIVVYLVKPDTAATWAFFVFCFSLGVYIVSGLSIQLPPHLVWLYALSVLAQPVYPAALLHLSLFFPEPTTLATRYPRVQYVPYAMALALGVYQFINIATMARAPLESDAFLAAHAQLLRGINLSRLYAILAATSLVLCSGLVYWRSRSMIAKQRSRVILFGSALAFLPPTLIMPFVLLAKIGVPFNLIVLPAFAFPVSVGYAIARHNLFDVDVYIKRALGYGFMTAVVGIGYLSTQTFVRTVILDPVFGGQAQHIYPILFAVLIVFFFNPINRRVQDSVDRIFFRRRLDYKETISAVSNALTSMLNLDQIVRQVVHTIRSEMFVETAGLLVLDAKARACQSFFVTDGRDPKAETLVEAAVGWDDPLLALMRTERRLITRYDIEEDPQFEPVREPCLARFADTRTSLAIPLVSQGQVSGVLALGDKKSGQFYGREDVDLLHTMANQAAVAIQNATAHQEVVRYAEELAASLRRIQLLESIRTNLAKFVPKTVQELIEESPEAPSFEKREVDVSVVFADITGYTRLSAELELDQVNRLVERYFGAFLDEIVKHGGDVNETVGDGLMVIFRDPEPPRHARAAVLAALGIQRRTAEINRELQGQFEPIAMHVGVNSGIAALGATKIEGAAGTRWTYTASGPTTNVAARVAALGEADAVILTEETWRRLGGQFAGDDLGPQSLKNVAQPVRVYRVRPDHVNSAIPVEPERRRHRREPVAWTLRLLVADQTIEVRAVDASAHGMCLADVPGGLLEVGKAYEAELVLPGQPRIACLAEVRNVRDGLVGVQTQQALPVRPPAP